MLNREYKVGDKLRIYSYHGKKTDITVVNVDFLDGDITYVEDKRGRVQTTRIAEVEYRRVKPLRVVVCGVLYALGLLLAVLV